MPKVLILLLFVAVSCAAENLSIDWKKNMLRISGKAVPGEYVEIWYLEAFCRGGSTHQNWDKTTIPHQTDVVSATPQKIVLRTRVEPAVVVDHVITAGESDVEFRLQARNEGDAFAEVQWFQPCMRVDRFTGAKQNDYISNSFIFTADGLRMLDKLPRNEEAIYRGGQVYVPPGIALKDVNPRPISSIRPANGLIGCYSQDGSKILATAWSDTQELFQGVIVCLHSDPRIGGLKPGESRALRGKVYILPNDPKLLLERYRSDFGSASRSQSEKPTP